MPYSTVSWHTDNLPSQGLCSGISVYHFSCTLGPLLSRIRVTALDTLWCYGNQSHNQSYWWVTFGQVTRSTDWQMVHQGVWHLGWGGGEWSKSSSCCSEEWRTLHLWIVSGIFHLVFLNHYSLWVIRLWKVKPQGRRLSWHKCFVCKQSTNETLCARHFQNVTPTLQSDGELQPITLCLVCVPLGSHKTNKKHPGALAPPLCSLHSWCSRDLWSCKFSFSLKLNLFY